MEVFVSIGRYRFTVKRQQDLVSPEIRHRYKLNRDTSVRVFSFSKKETVIKFELAAPEETDAAATKVLVTPTWKIEGAVAKVEACNNGFDAVPTWEDITAMVQINRVYNFTNKTKTASKWGVNIRFTITKNEGFEGEVSISGFGGAYE